MVFDFSDLTEPTEPVEMARPKPVRKPRSRFGSGLSLRILHGLLQAGKPLTTRQIFAYAHGGRGTTAVVLNRLQAADLVRKAGRREWELTAEGRRFALTLDGRPRGAPEGCRLGPGEEAEEVTVRQPQAMRAKLRHWL
jgi:hypothetical protein